MKDVGLDDFYEVRQMGQISDLDIRSLLDLYEPLIGGKAIACYLSLMMDSSSGVSGVTLTHDKLFNRLSYSPGEFYQAMEALEAVGLAKTFFKEGAGVHYFVYCLYSPKDPSRFFDDVLFVGMLKKYLDKDSFDSLVKKYQKPKEVSGFSEVTESFVSFYNPDFDDPIFKGKLRYEVGGHASARPLIEFNYTEFFRTLGDKLIKEDDLSKAERSRAEKLSALYSLEASTMAEIIFHNYERSRPIGHRVDWKKAEAECRDSLNFPYLHNQPKKSVPSEVSGDSDLAKKIRLMDIKTPVQWLSLLQGSRPAPSDLKILESLSLDYGLSASVINALVDYVLTQNDNVLAKPLCEKIAASLKREGVLTARDAMDYLKRVSDKLFYKGKPNGNGNKGGYVPKGEPTSGAPQEVSDEDVQKALASLYNK